MWLILIAATLLLFALAEGGPGTPAVTALVIAIAAFKVRLVFLHFMELAGGAMPWRALAEAWVLGVALLILGFQFATAG